MANLIVIPFNIIIRKIKLFSFQALHFLYRLFSQVSYQIFLSLFLLFSKVILYHTIKLNYLPLLSFLTFL